MPAPETQKQPRLQNLGASGSEAVDCLHPAAPRYNASPVLCHPSPSRLGRLFFWYESRIVNSLAHVWRDAHLGGAIVAVAVGRLCQPEALGKSLESLWGLFG